jgi:diguanylate cyclase (GGDEF)-like protein
MSKSEPSTAPRRAATIDDLRRWIREQLDAPEAQKRELLASIADVFDRQRELWQTSKLEAVQALSEGFADKLGRLQTQLLAKEATVRNIANYFEEVVAGLTDKANRDPKTRLMNFEWFMQRLESFLAIEQRVRCCAVGIVDISSFKWFNDNLGHAVGDRIIERVAQLLADRLRSRDLITQDTGPRDLHARFGGDEFAFLVTDLPGPDEACTVAGRFKRNVEEYAWEREDPRLAERPVRVDVGVVCLRLGPLDDRRGVARTLAQLLIDRADQLMYAAKTDRSASIYLTTAEITAGRLRETGVGQPCSERGTGATRKSP